MSDAHGRHKQTSGIGRGLLLRQYLAPQTTSPLSSRQSPESHFFNFEESPSALPKSSSPISHHIPKISFDELDFSPDEDGPSHGRKIFSFGNVSGEEKNSSESSESENSYKFRIQSSVPRSKNTSLDLNSSSKDDSGSETDVFRSHLDNSKKNVGTFKMDYKRLIEKATSNYIDNQRFSEEKSSYHMSSQQDSNQRLESGRGYKPMGDVSQHTNSSEKPKTKENFFSDYAIGHMIQRMEKSCGIIHGKIISKPISNIAELKLHPIVYSSLCAKKIDDLTRSQMFGIPVLLQRRNLILVGPSLTGKTFACVIGILSLLFDEKFYSELPNYKTGPRVVFLTPNSHSVHEVAHQCNIIGNQKLKVLTAHGGGLEKERASDLANGCDILVTTPRCWLRLLMYSITDMDRLCHVIFDDSDVMFSTFKNEIKTILYSFNKLLEKRIENKHSYGIHVTVVAEKWTKEHDDCLHVIKSPVVTITSHLEAALYSRIKPIARIVASDVKLTKLLELLEKSKNYRTIVMCKSAEEVRTLRLHLPHSIHEVVVAHDEMGFADLCDICNIWERNLSVRIMLCSDSVLGQLAITNAQHLIHFSLPVNKSYFSERFSTIQDHFIDRAQNPELRGPDCWVNILLDNQNVLQFPEIVAFLERLNTPIPQSVKNIIKSINRQKEEEKIDMPICSDILMFGSCHKTKKCQKRHLFSKEKDTPKKLPETGLIKMKCLLIHNPSHYSVRIIALKEKEGDQWQDFKSNYAIVGFKMAKYYSKRINRIPHGMVNVGDLVTVEVEMDHHYSRGLVTEIFSKDEKQKPVNVIVNLIDEGANKKCKALSLLRLPPELQTYDPEAYDVYISGIYPVDYDPKWSAASKIKLREGFRRATSDAEDHFFVAKVALVVGNNIITSSFLCHEWLEGSQCYSVLFSPRKFIMKTHLAEPNDEHLPAILSLAAEANLKFECPGDTKEERKNNEEAPVFYETPKQKIEPIQWAHLDKDYFMLTYVSFCFSPSLFYLQIRINFDLLSALEKDLSKILDDKVIKPKSIEHGMMCAVKNSDSQVWNRAMVLKVQDSTIDAFCVDYGDILIVSDSEVSLLPQDFISRLPFQAIECSLVGVSCTDPQSNWSDDAIDFFTSLISNDEGEMKCLYARVCETKQSETMKSKHYQVLLLDTCENSELLLNKELIIKGFANWAPDSTKKYITDRSYLEATKPYSLETHGNVNDKKIDAEYDSEDSTLDSEEVWTEENTIDYSKVGKTIEDAAKSATDENSKKVNDIIELLQKNDFDFEFPLQKLKEFSSPIVDFLPTSLQNLLRDDKTNLKAIEGTSQENVGSVRNLLEPIKSGANEKGQHALVEEANENYIYESSGNGDKMHQAYDLIVLLEKGLPLIADKEIKVLCPTIVWSQTDLSVKISVMVPDIHDYLVFCCFQQVIFKCIVNEKIYAFELKLFGPVNKDKTQYVLQGQHFDVIMQKKVPGNWPRLAYERNVKSSWIKTDASSLVPKNLSVLEIALTRGETKKEAPEERKERLARRELDLNNPYSRIPDIFYSDSENSEGHVASDAEEYDDL